MIFICYVILFEDEMVCGSVGGQGFHWDSYEFHVKRTRERLMNISIHTSTYVNPKYYYIYPNTIRYIIRRKTKTSEYPGKYNHIYLGEVRYHVFMVSNLLKKTYPKIFSLTS